MLDVDGPKDRTTGREGEKDVQRAERGNGPRAREMSRRKEDRVFLPLIFVSVRFLYTTSLASGAGDRISVFCCRHRSGQREGEIFPEN